MKQQCAKYQYVVTPTGPKILPVDEPSCKDEESPADYNAGGYLPVKLNDTFRNGRYRVVRKLGWGHFSTVWLVKDEESNCHSALKIVKSAGRYAETARDEIKLLSRVASFSPNHPGRPFIVSFLDSFCHQGPEASHVCIVFEPLGENLLALIERHKKKGVPKALVRVIAKQVLLGLQYLHDECDLVHTDIKPENILISIPDIEAHIHTELTLSPSPTSRRVGVPLPNKSRSGVTIPQRNNSSRKSVHIFDSQPLPSPGRSAGLSMSQRSPGPLNPSGGSGSNSLAGSYTSVAQIHMSRLGATISGNGTSVALAKGLPNPPGGLTISAPRPDAPPPSNAKTHLATSPSTSSSSSSIASTSTKSTDAAPSSVFSTPPTSLSYSIGSAMLGVIGIAKSASKLNRSEEPEKEPIGVSIPKGKAKENEPSTSWKERLESSWRDRMAFSTSHQSSTSSLSGISPNSSEPVPRSSTGHSRTASGISVSGSWKDPGLAAPAPAVVVSTVVRADGEEDGDYFRLASTMSTSLGSTIKSESSSATATIVRPSPTGAQERRESASETSSPPVLDLTPPSNSRPAHSTNPSLLSQTAPSRTNKRRSTKSPPSQPLHPTSSPAKPARRSLHKVSISTTAVDNTPTVSPSAPPPTPNTTPASSLTSPSKPTPIPLALTPPHSVPFTPTPPVPPRVSIKIADLGNATPSSKHFTEDIQTRQYRAPEAILGRKDWDGKADIWSVACVIFELLTAEYLFDPQGQGQVFTKDDDHMAQIIELLGDFALDAKIGGKYSRELFDHTGALRYIRTLKPWPLERVMVEKYLYSEQESHDLCDFLHPMLVVDQKQRAHARDMINHPWLEPSLSDETIDEW